MLKVIVIWRFKKYATIGSWAKGKSRSITKGHLREVNPWQSLRDHRYLVVILVIQVGCNDRKGATRVSISISTISRRLRSTEEQGNRGYEL